MSQSLRFPQDARIIKTKVPFEAHTLSLIEKTMTKHFPQFLAPNLQTPLVGGNHMLEVLPKTFFLVIQNIMVLDLNNSIRSQFFSIRTW
jgi:hypothetical protein